MSQCSVEVRRPSRKSCCRSSVIVEKVPHLLRCSTCATLTPMPMKLSRENRIRYPEWVESITDACLSGAVKEALKARDTAIESGALKDPGCRGALRSADTSLEQIQFGRVRDAVACRKAATAMRKYAVAGECAVPTARGRYR
jgi:hypothetical protein